MNTNKKLKDQINHQRERLPYPDYFRGIIIFLMIQGHLFRALLDKNLKSGLWFNVHEPVHGMVAPGFLFLAGFLFYHTIHNKNVPELLDKGRHLFGILLWGYFLHLPFFSMHKIISLWGTGVEYKLLRMDILHTIGFSLLIATAAWILIRKYFFPFILLLTAFNLIYPFFYVRPDNILLASFVDAKMSQFPLVYWSVFLFLGILASGYLKKFNPVVLAASVLMILAVVISPGLTFEIISDTGKVLLLFSLVRLIPPANSRIIKKFLTASRESLFLYLSHLMIVYGSPLNPGLSRYYKESLSFPVVLAIFILMVLILYPAAYFLNRIRSTHPGAYRTVKYAVFTFFFFVFLFSKW